MTGVDRSQFQAVGSLPADATFAIERVAHGTTEDTTWRDRYNEDVARLGSKGVGFYYVPESTDVATQARFFAGLVAAIPAGMGLWLDYAAGDLGALNPSVAFVDEFRSVVDCGLYTNGSYLAGPLAAYQRFERLWFAGTTPPARWLMWQTGKLDQGADIDLAADTGGIVRPHWTAFSWPNP